MVKLFLREPKWSDNTHGHVIVPLLNKLGSHIESLVSHGAARSEARLWLCRALSSLTLSPSRQVKIFMKILRSKPRKTQLLSQLLQMMFDKRPSDLGSVLAKRSYLLENFFEGNPKGIQAWFSAFAYGGGSDHKRGARALAQFAFANRDLCWEELEWRGKHGQSPAVVATKPHYFLDLDIQRTIHNFLHNVPHFWSSTEFADSLRDGQILFLDTSFFLRLFIRLMYQDDVDDVWDAVEAFLTEEPFSSLTQHLLLTLPESDLHQFLGLLGTNLSPGAEPWDVSSWLQVALSRYAETGSMEELLLLNSVINQGRQLLRVVSDENLGDELKETLAEICRALGSCSSFPLVMRDVSKMKHIEVIRLMGLLSWTVHFWLSEECRTPESWEFLFRENGIEFRRSSDHSLLTHKGFSEESESDSDSRSKKRRTKKRRKKKRKREVDDDDDDDGLMEDEILGMHQITPSWLLSTDGFSSTWTSVDLPEYISRYCLSSWMKWLQGRTK